jgi:hypothetical protein
LPSFSRMLIDGDGVIFSGRVPSDKTGAQ